MRRELLSLQRKLGLTTIFVTHDQEKANTTANRMAVLDKGVLQQVGSASGLYDYPANRFVAGFVGTANVLEGRVTAVTGDTLTFDARGLGELHLPRPADAPAPGAAALAFRPHQVDMRVPGEPADASRLWVDGVVESAEFLGESSRYRVRTGDAAVMAALARGEEVDPADYYFRASVGFETGSERYRWLNRAVAVAAAARLPSSVLLDVYTLT